MVFLKYAPGARIVHTCKWTKMRTRVFVAALKKESGFTAISGVTVLNANSNAANEYIIYLDMTAGMYGATKQMGYKRCVPSQSLPQ